jgi:hypothetical protein
MSKHYPVEQRERASGQRRGQQFQSLESFRSLLVGHLTAKSLCPRGPDMALRSAMPRRRGSRATLSAVRMPLRRKRSPGPASTTRP